jgi:hypothetical protein
MAKLIQNTRPNRNRSDADTDEECRVRGSNDPANARADYSKRNNVRQYVVHAAVDFYARRSLQASVVRQPLLPA